MARATLAQWLAPLALASDAGAALPPETAFRTALLGLRAAELSSEKIDPAEVFFGGLLRHLGCSATAMNETQMMGDERELRSSMALADAASPASMFSAARRGFGAGKSRRERVRRVTRFLVKAPREVPRIFSDRCEVAMHLAARLGLPYILERFAPELESFGVTANGRAKAPWHFAGSRREHAAKYFEALLGTMEPLRVEPQHYAAAEDYVYATLYQEWKVRKTGKALPMKNGVHRFKVKDGKVVEWFAAEDTQLTIEALG